MSSCRATNANHERAVRELEAARIALSNFQGTVKELERRLEEKSKP